MEVNSMHFLKHFLVTKKIVRLVKYSVLGSCLIGCLSHAALAEVTAGAANTAVLPSIKLGKSVGATGESGRVGRGMILGSNIYLDQINQAGGIQGRKVEMIALNDGYEPVRAAENVRQLIDKDQVLALVGNNGSPTTAVVLPIVNEKKALLFGTYSGAAFLYKKPPDRYVFSFRASFAEEAAEMIKGLLSAGIKPSEIAFFGQNDAYGQAVYQGCIQALQANGYPQIESLPRGDFSRNTLNVEGALAQIMEEMKEPPKAIILGGNFGSNTKFAKLAVHQFPKVYILAVTGLINSSELTEQEQKRIIATQVVPVIDSNLPAVREYRDALKKYGNNAQSDSVSLESYLGTKLFVLALQKAVVENKLTGEGIIDTLESMHDIDIGLGLKISFDKAHHQALHKVWVTQLKDGKFVPFLWSEIQTASNK